MFLTWNFLSEAAELKLSLLIGLLPFAPWVANDQSGFLELRECTHYEKLITFANYSNPSSSFVNIKVSLYTGIFPCFIPPKDNPELKQTFAQYGVNTPRLDRLGSKLRQRVHCLQCNVRPMCSF